MMQATKLKEVTQCKDTCVHCGLPLPRGQKDRDFDNDQFCCRGCQAVHTLIQKSGLSGFYSLRDSLEVTLTPVRIARETYEHFDDSIFQEKHVLLREDEGEVRFCLDRIHCAACVWLLQRLPTVVPGVISVTPNSGNSTALVRYSSKEVPLSLIAQSLADLGYRPSPYSTNEVAKSKGRFERQALLRLGIAGFSAGNTMLLAVALYQGAFTGIEENFESLFRWVSFFLSIPALFYSALPFYRSSYAGLLLRRIHIDLPISLGILCGFFASVWQTLEGGAHVYFDSICALIFFLLAGRWVQYQVVEKAKSAMQVKTLVPDSVRVSTADGERQCLLERLAIGSLVVVHPGEVIPIDGTVMRGQSAVNNAHLTGEARPISVSPGDTVLAGAVNYDANLVIQVVAVGADTRLGVLMDEVRLNAEQQVPYQNMTTRCSAYFTLLVLVLAMTTFWIWLDRSLDAALTYAIALLVVCCPCALGLAAPLATSIALMRALRNGIFIQNAEILEQVVNVNHIVLDKTGTLTKGNCTVESVLYVDSMFNPEELAARVLELEHNSQHPYAAAFRQHFTDISKSCDFTHIENQLRGLVATDRSARTWRLGSVYYLQESGVRISESGQSFIANVLQDGLSVCGFSCDTQLLALFAFGDELHSGAASLLRYFGQKKMHISILSGDDPVVVAALASRLDFRFAHFLGNCLPEQKAAHVRQWQSQQCVAMVGDGVNDALALAQAHVGIAVRGEAEASLRAADIFMGSGELLSLRSVFEGSKKTLGVIKRNFALALGYNVFGVYLAMSGQITPLIAAILMPISSICIILSSVKNSAFVCTDCE